MDPESELYSVRESIEGDEASEVPNKLKPCVWKTESEDQDNCNTANLFDRIYQETATDAEQDFFMQFDCATDYSWDDYSDVLEEKDESIRQSIDAIREEASRFDSIMAMDQLDTLKQELDEIKRELRNKESELAEQRCLIRLKDDRLATLELECDLHKADAGKLKTDLHKSKKEQKRRERSTDEATWAALSQHEREDSSDKVSLEESGKVSEPNQRTEKRPERPTLRVRTADGLSVQNLSTAEANFLGSTKRLASIIVCRKKKERNDLRQSSLLRAAYPTIANMNRRVQVFPEIELPCVSLEAQVEELHQRLKASIETAEELRRRLAMVSCYYENMTRRLQARLHATKADQAKMEEDLLSQIACISESKKRAIDALEAKLREKDDEIERLRDKDDEIERLRTVQ